MFAAVGQLQSEIVSERIELNIRLDKPGHVCSSDEIAIREAAAMKVLKLHAPIETRSDLMSVYGRRDREFAPYLLVRMKVADWTRTFIYLHQVTAMLEQDCIAVLHLAHNRVEYVGPRIEEWGKPQTSLFHRFEDATEGALHRSPFSESRWG